MPLLRHFNILKRITVGLTNMPGSKGLLLVKICRMAPRNLSNLCCLNNKWRMQQGLEADPRKFGPLINLPDYSFLDGRPVPLGRRKKTKVEQQMALCKRIAELTNEIDVGLELYNKNLEKRKEEREAILKNKLKPKGVTVLEKKKN